MARELNRLQTIEQSMVKKFRKELWAPFLTAVNQYELIQENDKIAVCISGGKDSMCMAKLLMLLQKHSDIPFELVYLIMDPGYKEKNLRKIKENAEILGLPITIFTTNIFAVADSQSHAPCYLCARMRRGHLYNKAKELGCNKIALGHHLNDVIETTLMSMFYSSKLETIVPKAKSENFEGMELIRPMYRIKEDDVIHWAKYNDLEFIRCACSMTERLALEDTDLSSKRQETKNLIQELKKENPDVEENLFRALHAVHVKTFPGLVLGKEKHDFLEFYPDGLLPEDKK